MIQWEYLHVRATVGLRDYSPTLSFDSREYARFQVNGREMTLEVKASSGADVQDSVVALLNQMGEEGWELVSHQERVMDGGLMRGPTEYSLFLKRPK